jgi:hypothetical protein
MTTPKFPGLSGTYPTNRRRFIKTTVQSAAAMSAITSAPFFTTLPGLINAWALVSSVSAGEA